METESTVRGIYCLQHLSSNFTKQNCDKEPITTSLPSTRPQNLQNIDAAKDNLNSKMSSNTSFSTAKPNAPLLSSKSKKHDVKLEYVLNSRENALFILQNMNRKIGLKHGCLPVLNSPRPSNASSRVTSRALSRSISRESSCVDFTNISSAATSTDSLDTSLYGHQKSGIKYDSTELKYVCCDEIQLEKARQCDSEIFEAIFTNRSSLLHTPMRQKQDIDTTFSPKYTSTDLPSATPLRLRSDHQDLSLIPIGVIQSNISPMSILALTNGPIADARVLHQEYETVFEATEENNNGSLSEIDERENNVKTFEYPDEQLMEVSPEEISIETIVKSDNQMTYAGPTNFASVYETEVIIPTSVTDQIVMNKEKLLTKRSNIHSSWIKTCIPLLIVFTYMSILLLIFHNYVYLPVAMSPNRVSQPLKLLPALSIQTRHHEHLQSNAAQLSYNLTMREDAPSQLNFRNSGSFCSHKRGSRSNVKKVIQPRKFAVTISARLEYNNKNDAYNGTISCTENNISILELRSQDYKSNAKAPLKWLLFTGISNARKRNKQYFVAA